nr:unnamed protein product [Callosobruchus analis]
MEQMLCQMCMEDYKL